MGPLADDGADAARGRLIDSSWSAAAAKETEMNNVNVVENIVVYYAGS